ncbi:MAG: hypothetical protein NTU63_04285 [Candidatus Pacearchaeota archaeon]|nr:hypothetical protein [Candidatus Pacearchaeota archaeon]
MKAINLNVQEQDHFCLCSVLQAILKKHGSNLSQKEIAKNLTPTELTPVKNGFIHNDSRIKGFMSRNGFSYLCFGTYETPFNEPDELLKEMSVNDGIIGFRKHAYLLKSFDKDKAELINPKNGKEVRIFYQDLLKRMGHTGFFGLIKYIS